MKFRTALSAMIVTALVASSVHAQTLRVTIRKAPIRLGPGSQETLVATAAEGDLLEYVDVEGLWYIVRVPATRQVGDVHSALVEQTAERAPAGPTAPPPSVAAPMAQPCAPPPPPPPRSPSRTSPPPPPPKREVEQLPNTQPSIDPTLDDAPWEHRGFGIGVRMGHSTVGNMAFNLRSFGRSLGLSFDLASDVDVLQLQPSLMTKRLQDRQSHRVGSRVLPALLRSRRERFLAPHRKSRYHIRRGCRCTRRCGPGIHRRAESHRVRGPGILLGPYRWRLPRRLLYQQFLGPIGSELRRGLVLQVVSSRSRRDPQFL